jgi:hypothetical protein
MGAGATPGRDRILYMELPSGPGDRSTPTLAYLYGPPAVGKLTVAEHLNLLTGWPIFHNHLSVNPVRAIFEFDSSPFRNVVHRLRLDIFQTAIAEGMSLIFTNNSAWSGPDGRERFAAFAATARSVVEDRGGRARFVRLTAPQAVLEERLASQSRQQHGKLADVPRLRTVLGSLDDSVLYEDDLTIDTSQLSAEEAALAIRPYVAGTGVAG